MLKDKLYTIIVFIILLHPFVSKAQVRLPQLIQDKMVLQRDTTIKIWGWAAPFEKIYLNFNGKKYRILAGSDSTWQVRLNSMKAGGQYKMDIRASNHIIINDILIGDV